MRRRIGLDQRPSAASIVSECAATGQVEGVTMMWLRTTLCSVTIAILLSISFLLPSNSVMAGSHTYTDDWFRFLCEPDGGCTSFSGTYRGSAWWNTSSSTNFFTKHESVTQGYPGHSDSTNPFMTMRFYHGGNLRFSIFSWDWNPCCYVIPGGHWLIGGHTESFTNGYSNSSSGELEGLWGFAMCTSLGCYGSVSDNYRWTIW
jgi:hypothetical protein